MTYSSSSSSPLGSETSSSSSSCFLLRPVIIGIRLKWRQLLRESVLDDAERQGWMGRWAGSCWDGRREKKRKATRKAVFRGRGRAKAGSSGEAVRTRAPLRPKPHCAPQSCCGERGAGSERLELSMDGSSVGAVGCGRGEGGYGNLAPQAEIHSPLRRKRESTVRSRRHTLATVYFHGSHKHLFAPSQFLGKGAFGIRTRTL